MRHKGFAIAMVALLILSVVQIPIMAANNVEETDKSFKEERYVGRYRQARDRGSTELRSGANTSIATYFDNDGNREQLVWTSSASASYTGDDLMYVADYNIKSKVLEYSRTEVISLLGANTGRSTFLTITCKKSSISQKSGIMFMENSFDNGLLISLYQRVLLLSFNTISFIELTLSY